MIRIASGRTRSIFPDLGDPDRNARLEGAVDAVIRQIVDIIDTENPKRKRP